MCLSSTLSKFLSKPFGQDRCLSYGVKFYPDMLFRVTIIFETLFCVSETHACLLYIDDLPGTVVNSIVHVFSDNCVICHSMSCRKDTDLLQYEFDLLKTSSGVIQIMLPIIIHVIEVNG